MHTSLRRRLGGFSLLEVMTVVAIASVLAAIAIPVFMRFQTRAKQAEAKAMLRSYFLSQRAYYGEHAAYVPRVDLVGFTIEGASRYFYRFNSPCTSLWNVPEPAPSGGYDCISQNTARFPGPRLLPPWTATLAGNAPLTPGVGGRCPSCQFTAAAIGDIDNDPVMDVWYITSVDGTVPAGQCLGDDTLVTAGLPHHFVNDAQCE